MTRKTLIAIAVLIVGFFSSHAWAGDRLAITIPKRSEMTPVQRLNREGVEAVNKHNYERASSLFYKAYLYDPGDPFTLNNLGYVSELQGELDRAHKFYELASEQGCNANIDRSNAKGLEGKPMEYAFENLQSIPMRVNRMNVDAMDLLANSRGFEAVALLLKALSLDPQNPFTINNLGVANEMIGDYDGALKYYTQASELRSSEPVVVTIDRTWRGRPVSKMAADSAKRLRNRISKMDNAQVRAVMLTIRGVSAENQNNWPAAKQDFLDAYSLDPGSAFSLNNRGYVAERDGDLETAQFFYEKARAAGDSGARVGLATQHAAEGKKLAVVATDSNDQVDGELDRYTEERHQQTGPIELTPRGGDSSKPDDNSPPSNAPPATDTATPQPQ